MSAWPYNMHKQSNPRFSRRSFLKATGALTLGAPFFMRDLMARPPSETLRHASFGASGMAWADLTNIAQARNVELVAVADVDLTKTAEVRKRFPGARVYQDWRELLAREAKRIDSVNVSVPDHMHGVMGMSVLELGKHLYCQKPLAHDLFEVRRLVERAGRTPVATQMGIQIHSVNHYRLAVMLIQSQVIGKIKEVHSWCPKSWGDTTPRPDRIDAIPAGLDWNLWLGVCEARPYLGEAYYHPDNWRKRLDFGTGTFGDMGCHIFDPVFSALELGAPLSVRSIGPAPNAWNWAMDSDIEYLFPGTAYTAGKTVKLHWYDGAGKLPTEVLALLEGDPRPGTGSIFVGTQGTLVLPHINRPLLYPDKKFANLQFPEVTSNNHWAQWADACRGKDRASAPFSYAGPLTEVVLLGGVASRFPQTTLFWDSKGLQFNLPEANQYLRRAYRPGWEVKGLA